MHFLQQVFPSLRQTPPSEAQVFVIWKPVPVDQRIAMNTKPSAARIAKMHRQVQTNITKEGSVYVLEIIQHYVISLFKTFPKDSTDF